MAQTQNAGGAGDVVIQYSIDGSTFSDLGGWASSATFRSWDRVTGSVNTIKGEEAILGFGKLTLTGMDLNFVYSDGDTTSDLIDVLMQQHAAVGGGMFMIRYSPQGTSSGKTYIQTNVDAEIDSLTLPDFDASSGAPLSGAFGVATSGFDKDTW